MTNEEWNRKTEFLLNQQAQFDADMRRMEAFQAETAKAIARTAETVASLSAMTFEGFKILSEAQKDLSKSHKELSESQKITDEQLRKLMAKVDRLTGEGRNGLQN